MSVDLAGTCNAIYKALLKRPLNDDERIAIASRFGGENPEPFDLETFLAQSIDSAEFFMANRDELFRKLIPEPCVVRAKGPLGDDLFVDLRQMHLGFAIATGHFEPTEVAFVRKFVRPGFHVLDIGANVGFFTTLFARLVGSTGSVQAFEPVGDTYRKLVASIGVNGWHHVVQTHNLALAGSAGTMEISYAERSQNMGGAHLVEGGEAPPGEQRERVRIARLDGVVPVRRYDFVKMDVEGAERLVIEGAGPIIRDHLPPMLIEFNDLQLRAVSKIEPEAFAEELMAYGYAPHEIVGDGDLTPLDNPIGTLGERLARNGIVNLVFLAR